MMKRLAILLTVLLASLFGLSAAQEQVTIGISIPTATHGWTGGVNYWARVTQERLQETYPNLNIVLVTSGSPAEQANALEDLVAVHNIDALVILPFESDPLTEPVRWVKEQGVFITVVDRGLADPDIQDIYVAGDNPGMGRVSAEFMVERLGGEGKIVVLRGIPTVIDNERVEAFMEVIEGTNIEVLGMEYANWNRDDGFRVMQDFLTRFPEIDAVWAQDDDIALGVLEAINQANRQDEMWVLGGAGMKEMIQRVMEGDEMVPANVTYPPAMIATAIEVTALHFVTGGAPMVGTYIIDSVLVTQENAEQFYFPDSPF
jgi:ribose transport system substrate-binding protein